MAGYGRQVRLLEAALADARDGLWDSLSFSWPLKVLFYSSRVRRALLKCVAFNGIFFAGILLERRVSPSIEKVVVPKVCFLFGPYCRQGLSGLFRGIYTVLWLLPICVLGFFLNTGWCREVAERTFHFQQLAKLKDGSSKGSVRCFAEEIYRVVFFLNCFALLAGLCLLHPVGRIAGLFWLSWICSLYCFEHKWALQGLGVEERVKLVEMRWPYFLGFGFPCAVLISASFCVVCSGTVCFGLVCFGMMCSGMAFPLSIMASMRSAKPPKAHERFPVFSLATWMSTMEISLLERYLALNKSPD